MRVKKKTHPIPDMNSEALKEFRQAAYELLVKAKDATSLVNGRSDDNEKCGMFSINHPETWADADTLIEIDRHPQLGQVKVRQWKNLHFDRAAGHPINLILVERIKPMSSGQPFPP